MADQGVVFYIMAHQDDWQLFRGEQAYADINTHSVRAIFIYATAGNAKVSRPRPAMVRWAARGLFVRLASGVDSSSAS